MKQSFPEGKMRGEHAGNAGGRNNFYSVDINLYLGIVKKKIRQPPESHRILHSGKYYLNTPSIMVNAKDKISLRTLRSL
jgi:hypothetical protein